MASLSDFSDEERNLLVSLPYKVGVWISHSDDTEGEQDDDVEMQALEKIIQEVAKHHEDMPFVHQIARETLRSKDKWDVWTNNCFHVPDECQKAITLLTSRVEEKSVKNYRKALLNIAHTVAEAWGEFDGATVETPAGFGALVGKISGVFAKNDNNNQVANVSAAEGSSLAQLAVALGE